MKLFVSVILLLVSITATAQTTIVVTVPPGDLNALRLAIDEANAGDPNIETIILTQGTFNFTEDLDLPDIHSQISIWGKLRPITFVITKEYNNHLVLIGADGSLKLTNIEFKGSAGGGVRNDAGIMIENEGVLELSRVQMNELRAKAYEGGSATAQIVWANPLIENKASGTLILNQVSFINSGNNICGDSRHCAGGLITNSGDASIQNSQLYYSNNNWSTPILNGGSMSLINVSIFYDNWKGDHSQFLHSAVLPIFTRGGDTRIANSIISGFSGIWCETVQSDGHNLVDHSDCDFTSEGDIVGEAAGLIWRPVDDRVVYNIWIGGMNIPSVEPILTHALVPIPASPAVDSINIELCPRGDIVSDLFLRRNDGNGDGIAKCDMGSFELQPTNLASGGINGLYFNLDADGHFLSILDNDYNTLVMWNSFDKDGNQYFVFGTGELVSGNSLIVKAYMTVDGSTSPEGEILPAGAVHWGTLEVNITSCYSGTLVFDSVLPEFGRGQVRLSRLAFVKQLGCVD